MHQGIVYSVFKEYIKCDFPTCAECLSTAKTACKAKGGHSICNTFVDPLSVPKFSMSP